MKNIYNIPEIKVISLLAKSDICAGEDDGVNGGQDENGVPSISGFFEDDTIIGG